MKIDEDLYSGYNSMLNNNKDQSKTGVAQRRAARGREVYS
jgi:hypothetical protein